MANNKNDGWEPVPQASNDGWEPVLTDDVQKPEQNIGQKVWGALDAYGKAGISNVVGAANGITAGLARPTVKAVTGQDIGEGSFLGKMAGAVAPAGLAGKGIGMVAKAANPLVRGALKLGGEGAVYGLGLTPEEDFQKYLQNTPRDIAMGGAGNILAGGALKLAGKGIEAATPFAKKAFEMAKSDIGRIINSKKIEELPSKIAEEIRNARMAKGADLDNSKILFQQKNKALGYQLKSAVESDARGIQETLAQNLRKVSPEYGKRLSQELSSAKGEMPVSDAIKIAQESLNEIETRGITNPEVKGILNEYIEKLTLVKTSPIMDQFGRPIQQINREAASSVPYSELAGIRTDVLSKLSNAGKSQGNFSQSDLAAIIFDSKVSGALSDALPGLKSLRGEYADFKKIATEAYKIVRPKTGEYNTRAIERLLSRHASGKTSAGEQELIKAIEKGTDLLPGSGKFYASSEAVGKELEILKNQNPIKLSQIKKQSEKLVDTLIKKKNLAQSEKRELQRAWVRAKVAGSLIGSGGAIAAYRAVT